MIVNRPTGVRLKCNVTRIFIVEKNFKCRNGRKGVFRCRRQIREERVLEHWSVYVSSCLSDQGKIF